jgi:DNA polymerase (family 10)
VENLVIARVLAEIGDLLEIKSENPFKIRAYRNAAETITHLAERLAGLTPAERLGLPGIGKDLAAKIGELIETGTCRYHQELLQEFPPTILDLLHLQGVGPKTVALLFQGLQIRTLDDLERAAREGRLRVLKGMGAKKEASILKALEERPRLTGRTTRPRPLLRNCARSPPRPTFPSSAACAADAKPAGTWTSWRPGRLPP